MDFFKVNPGLSRIWPILRTSYETATGQNKKYKRKSRSGLSYFAVCPICDNPIQLIGLYRDTAESGRKPYGKHCRHTVPDLAEYDEDAYLDCPYSDPNRTPPTSRCKLESRISKQILQLLHAAGGAGTAPDHSGAVPGDTVYRPADPTRESRVQAAVIPVAQNTYTDL